MKNVLINENDATLQSRNGLTAYACPSRAILVDRGLFTGDHRLENLMSRH